MPQRTRFGTNLPPIIPSIEVILKAQDINYTVITTTPPKGCYKITNIYYNPQLNRIIIQYDDTPVS